MAKRLFKKLLRNSEDFCDHRCITYKEFGEMNRAIWSEIVAADLHEDVCALLRSR